LAARDESPTASRALRRSIEPSAIGLDIGDHITCDEVPRLCERVRELLESSDANVVVCDVGALLDPDVASVGALARLLLVTRRLGCEIRFFGACDQLQELFALMGLGDVVPLCGELPLQSRGKAEQREETRGVEEKRDPADPTT
jgi:ABC-type transporter Mla MlaB component